MIAYNKFYFKNNFLLLSEQPFHAILNLFVGAINLPAIIAYPIIGGNINSFLYNENQSVTITLSKYKGLIPFFQEFQKAHEFLHCYHYLLSVDKMYEHLNLFEGMSNFSKEKILFELISEIGSQPIPNGKEMKLYEKKILEKIISSKRE